MSARSDHRKPATDVFLMWHYATSRIDHRRLIRLQQRSKAPSPSHPGVDSMFLECADITIPPGKQAEFDRAIQHGLETVLSQSPGYRGYKVQRGVESPERYLLWVWWERLEDHTIGFRESARFAQWRSIVGPFFAKPPLVEHFQLVCESK
jgi:heme-degrading monooxygenase HmoA